MNSNLLVGKFYTMDPETEDLVYADQLKEGMVVLVESAALRADPNDPSLVGDPAWNNHLMKANRWCEVSNLRRIPTPHEVQIQFVGIYANGEKRVRIYNSNVGLFVKKDSLPAEVIGTVTSVSEDESGITVTGVLNEQGMAYAKADAEDSVTLTQLGTGRTASISKEELGLSGIKTPQSFVEMTKGSSMDIQSADGPLARALRQGSRPSYVPGQ